MMLKDKILRAALDYIQEHEGVPAIVVRWKVFSLPRSSKNHRFIASVMVATDQGYEPFDVWVMVDLDTEEVTRI